MWATKTPIGLTVAALMVGSPLTANCAPVLSDELQITIDGLTLLPMRTENANDVDEQPFTQNFTNNDPNLKPGVVYLTEKNDTKTASDKIELKDNGNNAFQLIFTFDVPAALPNGAKALPETGDFQALTTANFGANWPFGADLPFTASIKSAVSDEVPEPSSLALLSIGLMAGSGALRRRRKAG